MATPIACTMSPVAATTRGVPTMGAIAVSTPRVVAATGDIVQAIGVAIEVAEAADASGNPQ